MAAGAALRCGRDTGANVLLIWTAIYTSPSNCGDLWYKEHRSEARRRGPAHAS